jgi:hypothetical protein
MTPLWQMIELASQHEGDTLALNQALYEAELLNPELPQAYWQAVTQALGQRRSYDT